MIRTLLGFALAGWAIAMFFATGGADLSVWILTILAAILLSSGRKAKAEAKRREEVDEQLLQYLQEEEEERRERHRTEGRAEELREQNERLKRRVRELEQDAYDDDDFADEWSGRYGDRPRRPPGERERDQSIERTRGRW